QPSPDVLQITLSAVAVAGAHPTCQSMAQMGFEVTQDIQVSFNDPKVKQAKLSIEGRVVGLLRTHKGGGQASSSEACAAITSGANEIISICTPERSVCAGGNLSINDFVAPKSASVVAGSVTVHQRWCVSARHPLSLFPHKAASAEFAPEPALD